MRIFHHSKKRQSGSSLIEMLIAMIVLTVGLIGSMALVGIAIGGDFRSKSDSTSTALAQLVTENISKVPVCNGACGAVATVTVTDCAGNAHVINVTGTAGGSGAPLTANGTVNFAAGTVPNYFMQYTECGVTNAIRTTYDVRWNIQTLPSNDAELVVVGAQLVGSTRGSAIANAPAVNIRTIVGNDGN